MDCLSVFKKDDAQVLPVSLRNPDPKPNSTIRLHRLHFRMGYDVLYPLVPDVQSVRPASDVVEVLRASYLTAVSIPAAAMPVEVYRPASRRRSAGLGLRLGRGASRHNPNRRDPRLLGIHGPSSLNVGTWIIRLHRSLTNSSLSGTYCGRVVQLGVST